MDMKNLVEVLLFATPEPLTQVRFSQIIQKENSVELDSIIDKLNLEYEKSEKGLRIQKIGGGYQVLSLPEYHVFIDRLFQKTRKLQLSRLIDLFRCRWRWRWRWRNLFSYRYYSFS